jgi:hypothetical protein
MYLAHSDMKSGSVNRKRRHVEVVAAGDAAQCNQLLARSFHIAAKILKICENHIIAEMIMASWNRRMRGKYSVCRHRLQRTVKIQSLPHQIPHAFKHHESRMPFIDMPYRRIYSQFPQSASAANAEYDFLFYSHDPVATIELMGYIAIIERIFRQVGIQQIEHHMADFCFPHLYHYGAMRQFYFDANFRAIGTQYRCERQILKIRISIGNLLVAEVINRLKEISLPVQQSDPDQWQAQIACRLAVIARKNSQPARIDWKAFMKTELETEVCNLVSGLERSRAVMPYGG